MKSWIPRNENFAAKQAATAIPMAVAALDASPANGPQKPMPDYVKQWLRQIRLLYGVPFEYLVCDEHYLPTESMRFFYIDRNWTDALVDGALSIGPTTRDVMFKGANLANIQTLLDGQENRVRTNLRGLATPRDDNNELICGFLLRSAVVSGYPGMEVHGYSDAAGTKTIGILRIDRLSPDMMLVLFSGKPELVSLQQPPEGLHFGVRNLDATQPDVYSVILRQINGENVGMPFVPAKTADVVRRPSTVVDTHTIEDVLDVTASAASIATALGVSDSLDPAAFGIEMIRASGLQDYKTGVPAQTNNKK
jgi:hypothetical protein